MKKGVYTTLIDQQLEDKEVEWLIHTYLYILYLSHIIIKYKSYIYYIHIFNIKSTIS